MRERKRDYAQGPVDSMMSMGYELVQPVTDWMGMVRSMRPICHVIHQIPKASQHGKNQEQQEGRPEIIEGYRRGENSKQHSHIVNLLYEVPKLVLSKGMIAHL